MRLFIFIGAAAASLASSTALASPNTWLAHEVGSDADADFIPDEAEQRMAVRHFPRLNMHVGQFEGIPHGSHGQFYGGNAGYATSGKIPFVAHIHQDTSSTLCDGWGECIEIRYGMAYNWDLGDDRFTNTAGAPHKGDSEIISLLLTTTHPWESAKRDPDAWFVSKTYLAAHACDTGESSSVNDVSQPLNVSVTPMVWVAEGKNGNYRSQSKCNDGGVAWADDCGDHRGVVDVNASRLQNAGEFGLATGASLYVVRRSMTADFRSGFMGLAGGNIIPYPGATQTTPPSGAYDVWSGQKFGTAGSFCRHLTRRINWPAKTWECQAHPECPP